MAGCRSHDVKNSQFILLVSISFSKMPDELNDQQICNGKRSISRQTHKKPHLNSLHPASTLSCVKQQSVHTDLSLLCK